MKRVYSEEPTENVKFFVGTEVEKSPAHGRKTLFVVGLQNVADIKKFAEEENVSHIYLGANMSFDGTNALTWGAVIKELLESDYWVTLDYKLVFYDTVLSYGLMKYSKYIDMISVPLPCVTDLNYNACIKLDDAGFSYSNPGVWVHTIHSLQNRENFTDWSTYKNDTVIS